MFESKRRRASVRELEMMSAWSGVANSKRTRVFDNNDVEDLIKEMAIERRNLECGITRKYRRGQRSVVRDQQEECLFGNCMPAAIRDGPDLVWPLDVDRYSPNAILSPLIHKTTSSI